jgi:hypothetical protein
MEHQDPSSQLPGSDVKLIERIALVETQVKEGKRLALASAVAAIVLGSGGVFGFVQWAINGPAMGRQLNQIKLDTDRYNLEVKRQADTQARKTENLELQSKLHHEAVQSLTRELGVARSSGDRALMRNLARQLADRERSYRSVLAQLRGGIGLQAANPLSSSLRTLIDDSEVFEATMRRIADSGSLEAETPSRADDALKSALVMADSRRIRFPPFQEVTIEAHGPAGKTFVVVGSLSLNALSLENIEHISPYDPRIVIDLAQGRRARFVTPGKGFVDLELTFTKVQDGPMKTLQDDGEIKPGTLRSASQNRTGAVAELVELPQGLEITIASRRRQ